MKRKLAGGSSARYDARRGARLATGTHAPDWGGVPAAATWLAMKDMCAKEAGLAEGTWIMQVLTSPDKMEELLVAVKKKSSQAIADRAEATLSYHSRRACEEGLQPGTPAARPMAEAVLRRLRERSAPVRSVGELDVSLPRRTRGARASQSGCLTTCRLTT